MRRKYLEDIGVTERPDNTWGQKGPDEREARWEQMREIYGFDDRETWALNDAFYMWLYERLMMYKEIGGEVVDLTFHKFKYQGQEYSQLELINKLLEMLKVYFKSGEYKFGDEDYTLMTEIGEIWAIILPAMWW